MSSATHFNKRVLTEIGISKPFVIKKSLKIVKSGRLTYKRHLAIFLELGYFRLKRAILLNPKNFFN